MDKRERDVRAKHPRVGGLILALSAAPTSTAAWSKGADGEERLGARLDELSCSRLLVLHDRRLPGRRANIDHVVVTPSGVWVVDAKFYSGRPARRTRGGLFSGRRDVLTVAGRDRSKLVEGMRRQVAVVEGVVGRDVPVHGALCFIDADWPLSSRGFGIDGVHVLAPRRLFTLLKQPGELTPADVEQCRRRLRSELPPA